MAKPKYPRGVYVDFGRTPSGGWRGELRFTITDGGNAIRVSGSDEGDSGPAAALHRAVSMADRLTSDPAIANLLPPGTVAAISTVRTLARAAKRGILGRKINGKPLWQHFSGAFGALAKALHHAEQGKSSAGMAGGPLLLADRHPDLTGIDGW